MSRQISLPKPLSGRQWEQDTIGRSGDTVLRLSKSGQPDWFAKLAPLDNCQSLHAEAARLDWLAQAGFPAAQIIECLEHEGNLWLITRALDGQDAARSAAAPRAKVTALAEALHRLHSIDPKACPFDEGLSVKFDQAEDRVNNRKVDGTDFDDQNVGKDPQALLSELRSKRPGEEALVVTHGDASLPNFILQDGRFSGVVDCARLGLADRYQDLSLIAWSIGYNLGRRWIAEFLNVYGLPHPDPQKMRFYKSLDEFF